MLRIAKVPFAIMKAHAEAAYPDECVGAMFGRTGADGKSVTLAMPLENSAEGSQRAFYQLSQDSLLAADRAARQMGLDMIGIYHSHPDAESYFSETDLQNSCPWYSFVVLSVMGGRYARATSWLPDLDRTRADPEPLEAPEDAGGPEAP